jgi:hypothetical protein
VCLVLLQHVDLLRKEPTVRFSRCKLTRAFERNPRFLPQFEATQHRAPGGMQQVIVVDLRGDRVQHGERGARALDLGDGDGAVERDRASDTAVQLTETRWAVPWSKA